MAITIVAVIGGFAAAIIRLQIVSKKQEKEE